MTIYKKRTPSHIYRKIYEQHYGPIPKDEEDRTFEIHHLDGDDSNNNPLNLVALSIKDHYDLHYSQNDWPACLTMSHRMKISPEEKSLLATLHANNRVQKGTHNLTKMEDGTSVSSDRVDNGTHNFLDSEFQRQNAIKRVEDGTHHFIGGELQRQAQKRLVAEGNHIFLDSEYQKRRMAKQLENGNHASQRRLCCVYCKRELDAANFAKYHGDKCKSKI